MESEVVTDLLSTNDRGRANNSALLSYTECFYEQLPYYLSIGMTISQYWDEDCKLVEYYRKADEIRKHDMNYMAWIQGAYIYHALCDVAPIFNGFAKNPKPQSYVEEPFILTQAEMEKRKEIAEQKRMEEMKNELIGKAMSINARMMNKEKGVE